MLRTYGLNKSGIYSYGLVGFNFFSGIHIWESQTALGFFGEMANVSNGRLYNQLPGATDYLIVTGTPGAEVFQCPDTQSYKDADSGEWLWFTEAGIRRNVLTSELNGFDFVNTFINYDSTDPFTLRSIGIKKAGYVMNATEIEETIEKFRLSVYWNNELNEKGEYKENREWEKKSWTLGVIFDQASVDLFYRMLLADGVEQTLNRKIKIDSCIKSLKLANLFETQWDDLVVLRSKGDGSTRLNWIKDSHNATKTGNPEYNEDLGWNSNANTGYLRTAFSPRNNGILFKRDDASFVLKVSGTINLNVHGVIGEANMYFGNAWDTAMNSAAYTVYDTTTRKVSGWNCNARDNAANFNAYRNSSAYNFAKVSLLPATYDPYILITNNWGSPSGYVPDTEIVELYAFGKYISQADFLTFQTIMNTYFASL